MASSFTRNAVVLGLLSAVGPFAIDMYLPALPAIAADLHATTSATQMTLIAFFVSFGLCQIVYGPLSDVYGRKLPLYGGLTLFILGAIGCAFSATIGWLIAFRFLQGIGAAMGVIPRAIIRDLHTGAEATKLMSLVMLVFSVSPILAPLTGSALIMPFGWRAAFVAVGVAALIALLLVAFLLPETRPAHERIPGSIRGVFGNFGELLQDWHFLGLTSSAGSAFPVSCVPVDIVVRLYRPIWPDADAIQHGILDQCRRLHRCLAIRGLPRRPLRHGPDGDGGRVGLCVVRCAVAGADAGGLRQPARADPAVVRVVRVSRARDSVDHGAVAGKSRPHRRHRLGARRHAADGRRRNNHRYCRAVLRRHLTANGRNGRCGLRGRPRPQPCNVAQEGAKAGRSGIRHWMTHRPRDLALPEVVDGRSQAVGRDVERRDRDRQPETPPARASGVQVEHAAHHFDLRHVGMA
jgi:multidrug resistance protein